MLCLYICMPVCSYFYLNCDSKSIFELKYYFIIQKSILDQNWLKHRFLTGFSDFSFKIKTFGFFYITSKQVDWSRFWKNCVWSHISHSIDFDLKIWNFELDFFPKMYKKIYFEFWLFWKFFISKCPKIIFTHKIEFIKFQGRLFQVRANKIASQDAALSKRLQNEAKSCFLGALSLFPAHIPSLKSLADIYRREGNMKMAEKMFW